MDTKNQKTSNRLINEASPYLLQHAHNPVDWYPWGKEAFEKAAKENKPIFLSIGYSSCHWCHVMEAESFESKHIAELLNANFVAIKVDREERPDLDEVYMSAVQAMAGAGGWPLSVFLTPQGKPFYGGTYFPPRDLFGKPGFEHVLSSIADAWKNRRDEVANSAENITNILTSAPTDGGFEQLKPHLLEETFTQLDNTFDAEYGGFGVSPKFPSPSYLSFLMCYWRRTGEEKALQMVTKTLDHIAAGGIYDQIGGGFHRYSTDRYWLIPHFEKMLYDQAMISRCYLQAWQITNNPAYSAVITDTFDYVLRDMRDAGGGFYSAEDADSEGKEGSFYLWTPREVEELLGESDADVFEEYYDITEDGNFEGKNILHRKFSVDELAENSDLNDTVVHEIVARGHQKLIERRNTRSRPGRDEKIIAGWNGLMIESLAYGGAALEEQKYIDAAVRAANFIFGTLLQNGRLMRYYRGGKVVEKACLDDYAAFMLATIALYETTFEIKWLKRAIELADHMIELFEDKQHGGFFLSGRDSEKLIVAAKPSYDGALPCGNSTAAGALLKLGHLTMNHAYTDAATNVFKTFARRLADGPTSLTHMMTAFNFWLGPAQEIVVAPGENQERAKEMIQRVQSRFFPTTVILLHDNVEIERIVPFVKSQTAFKNKTAAYICDNYVCQRPITELMEFEKIIYKGIAYGTY